MHSKKMTDAGFFLKVINRNLQGGSVYVAGSEAEYAASFEEIGLTETVTPGDIDIYIRLDDGVDPDENIIGDLVRQVRDTVVSYYDNFCDYKLMAETPGHQRIDLTFARRTDRSVLQLHTRNPQWTVEQRLNSFDFLHCGFAYTTDTLYWLDGAVDAVNDRRLILNNPQSYVVSLYRVQKYAQRGYSLSPAQYRKLLENAYHEILAKHLDRPEGFDVAQYLQGISFTYVEGVV